jgi:hypothetical protein
MPRYPDPHARLACTLAELAQGEILESRQTPWASATFAGARHHYVLHVSHPDHHRLDHLEEREFDLPGHILADIVLSGPDSGTSGGIFTVEALTVEDARP